MFDLDDDNQEEILFTHKGKVLDDKDDFDEKIENSDSEQGELPEEMVEQLHFGGGETKASDQEDDFFKVKKTKEQVFAEIMLKSKFYKEQKAQEKEENQEQI